MESKASGIKSNGTATLTYMNKRIELPVYSATEGPDVVDIRKLYSDADLFTYDPGFTSTASCESDITFIDGDKGILLYRGYPIGQLVEHGSYAAVANLLWTSEWDPEAKLPPAPVPPAVLAALRELPRDAAPMDALRTAVSVAMSRFLIFSSMPAML